MKIAIVHEMLVKLWGAEKVVEKLTEIFPEADIFTAIYDEKKVGSIFPKEKIKAIGNWTQKIYQLTKNQRFCLPFMAKTIEEFDFSNYNIVLVSSSWFAHGIITKPETKTIIYYHSPARYLWDWTNEYKKDIGADKGIKSFLFNRLFLKLREWDYIASQRKSINLANSKNVQKRIQKYYKKDSLVIYPPIETKRFWKKIDTKNFEKKYNIKENNYFIIISALSEFKRIDLAIKNFPLWKEKLIIIGNGKQREKLESIANKNTLFLWAQYGENLVELVQKSKGLIFPWEEDFWIVPIEWLAAGKPVFAYFWWWLKETIQENTFGNFFYDKTGTDFKKYFEVFKKNIEAWVFKKEVLQKEAEKYSKERFEKEVKEIVNKK